MSEYEKTSILIQALSAIAVATALIFAYIQSKAASDQAKLLRRSLIQDAYITFESTILDFTKVMIDNSEVMPFFYQSYDFEDIKNPELSFKVFTVAVFCLDFFDHVLATERLIPGATNWSEANWENWIEGMFLSSPVIRHVIRLYPDWYDTRLLVIAQRIESTLADMANDHDINI